MARIGRQIPHFELVDLHSIKAIFSANKKYRYLLTMEYRKTLLEGERDKTAVLILKNPSAADSDLADATIRKVETFIYHRFPDVKRLHILNIFAFRATDSKDLNEAYLRGGPEEVIGDENDRIIKSTLLESDYNILAWGNRSAIDKVLYEERVFRVKQLLLELPVYKIFQIVGAQKTKHPLHGLMWGYNYSIKPVGNYLDQA